MMPDLQAIIITLALIVGLIYLLYKEEISVLYRPAAIFIVFCGLDEQGRSYLIKSYVYVDD